MNRSWKQLVLLLLFFIFTLSLSAQTKESIARIQTSFNQLLSSTQALIAEGRYSEALRILQQSLKFAKTEEEKKVSYFNLAEVNANLGQLPQAYERYSQCLDVARKLADTKTANYCEKSLEILDLYNKAKNFI
ncbi:MAG: hypothetical protein ACPLRA_01740 [Candidatus Saccharicenans sp.]